MLFDTVAVVLTHRRWRLATEVVRELVDTEGFAPDQVIVVVNGHGGLDDEELEAAVRLHRLPENLGPAGGYRAGLMAAHRCGAEWIYVCEDDIGLFDLPHPRVGDLVERVAEHERTHPDDLPVGGVVAYGRTLDPRTGLTLPADVPPTGLHRVDVAAWGASLVRGRVIDAGILPDASMFFGYEDFEFWLRMQRAGFQLLVDGVATAAVADAVTDTGRAATLHRDRPLDHEEFWRAYYQARNFFVLRRRYGSARWTRRHLLKSIRRFQRAGSAKGRGALVRGLLDGARGETGRNDRFQRTTGEHPAS